jgi:hypothetical protein
MLCDYDFPGREWNQPANAVILQILRFGVVSGLPFSIVSNLVEASTDWMDLAVLMESGARLVDRDRMAICSAGDIHDMERRLRAEYGEDFLVEFSTNFTHHIRCSASGRFLLVTRFCVLGHHA